MIAEARRQRFMQGHVGENIIYFVAVFLWPYVMPKLTVLDLNETEVGDQSLPYLKEMTTLRRLVLRGTNMSNEARKELRQSLPDCQIWN